MSDSYCHTTLLDKSSVLSGHIGNVLTNRSWTDSVSDSCCHTTLLDKSSVLSGHIGNVLTNRSWTDSVSDSCCHTTLLDKSSVLSGYIGNVLTNRSWTDSTQDSQSRTIQADRLAGHSHSHRCNGLWCCHVVYSTQHSLGQSSVSHRKLSRQCSVWIVHGTVGGGGQ